jgi:hypothetical protein
MRQSAWVQVSALRVDTDLENLMGVEMQRRLASGR